MILHLKVKPNSKLNQLIVKGNEIVCKIKSPPVDGKANECLIEYLSGLFDLPKSKIQLLKGGSNQYKKLFIQAEEHIIYAIIRQNN